MRSHILTRVVNISPRYKRLAFISIFLGLILLSTSKSLSFSDPFDDQLSSYIPSKDKVKETILQYFYQDDNNNIMKDLTSNDLDEEEVKQVLKSHNEAKDNVNSQLFYTDLIESFHSYADQIPKLELTKKTEYDRSDPFTKAKLLEFLTIEPSDLSKFKDIHQEVYDSIPSKFPKNLYKGDGIVFIGGGQYSWLSLLSIKSLRSFGCKLPIEMVIPTEEEYEHDLCEEILPALNGKCVLLSNALGDKILEKVKFSGYQYKSLALIASSFDNTMLLDSDNILISNPEEFFKSEVYEKNGMVVWPDYWERTTSPYFYDIAGIEVNETVRLRDGKWDLPEPENVTDLTTVKYHDLKGALPDLSSESGQLLIRKNDHVKTILLSFFYNLYGPGFFYTLLGQGNSGEGDKDTFIAAALKGGESFYQVKSSIKTFGHPKNGGYEGVSMGQKNPVDDYEEYSQLDLSDPSKFDEAGKISVFTVHANYPKLNPFLLYKENKLLDENNKPFRLYSDIANFLNPVEGKKFDFEFVQFKRMKYMLCDLNISLKYFNGVSRNELCAFVDAHLNFLSENPI